MIDGYYRRTKDYVLKLPLITWALLGFLVPFISFFIVPIFFDPSQKMQFPKYILMLAPIGHDYGSIVSSSSQWIHNGAIPSILYPPFTLLFFAPFTFLTYSRGYKILILFILLGYILVTLVLPKWIYKQKSVSAFAMLVFITGIVSYGFQFELERGQWNIIAFSFSLAAIWIFHGFPKLRWLAYLLFSVSIQLKLYPAIFVFVLIDNWSDWANNVRRIVGLGVFNLLALFVF
jgi:hypothetical protein